MAVIAKQLRKPITRLIEKEAREMLAMYRVFAERIDKKIGPLRVAVDTGSDVNYAYTQMERVSRNIAAEIVRLEEEIAAWERKEYPQIYGAGQIDALLEMGGGTDQLGFAKGVMSRRSMELLSEEISMMQNSNPFHANALKILNETLYTGKNITATVGRRYDDVFRAMGLNVASGVAAGDETWRQAMRRELKMFDEMGIKSFTDAGGHRWKLKDYAEMVSRTVPMHVLHVGKMNEFLEYGEDLVEVSTLTPSGNSPCALCAPWEGEILSISGQTEGYPTVADAENAGLFHPRCFHNFALYIPELEKGSSTLRNQGAEEAGTPGEALIEAEGAAGLSSGKGDTDGISTVTSKESFDISDEKAVEAAFSRFAKETAGSAIEKAVVVSPDGNKYEIDGRSYMVGIDAVGADALRGAKVIHNHPADRYGPGDSFSEQDFSNFFGCGLGRLEVVYTGQHHRMEWNDKKVKRLSKDEAKDIYEKAYRQLRNNVVVGKGNVEVSQYGVMKYLQEHQRGLIFREL
jgi:hypothetical protein